ncbi:hypothetical protein CupriaWKF_31195 [Cupriavidus sp. WKF15]|uniref:hypothetical protein n=1 Tax=Cupriavidus sp. WKF15 TaxID=3032282 RepID=UPI0023E198F9|nr:hypothetical protein [Cupriavidus sp. WKF15]WER50820.1 hypothetical protein CupriaWKF_31195 [Cupriavidus sp. WKF15]
MNDAVGPVHVIQTEVRDFSGPHPGPREQQHDCRVPQRLKRRSIGHAFDEPIHIVARQARWKRRVTPSPDSWQRFLETGRHQSPDGEKT